MNHLGTKRIETDRLILRKFTMDDAEDMYDNWAGDDDVTKFLTWPTHLNVDVSKCVIGMWEKEYDSPNNYQWCIELKEIGEAIGSIGVVNLNEKANAVEVGYCIGKKFWGKGITPEAFRALIAFFFNEMQVNRVESRHDSRNPSSGKVMSKCGLIKEGVKRQADINNSGICDAVFYGLLKDEWNRNKSDLDSRAYEGFTEDEDSYSYIIEWPCIKEMLPNLNGKKILDLGCGTGRFSFLFEKENPSSILGIDISEQMLSIAKEKAESRKSNARFVQGDISNLDKYVKEQFDFIFSSTTFHYIYDINGLFAKIYQALDNNGVCIISIMHPVYTAQYPIDKNGEFPSDDEWIVRYLDKSKRAYIQPWIEYNDNIENYLSTSYHHTIGDYINAIIGAGFKIGKIEEPYPPDKWKQTSFGRYDAFIETPSYMIVKLTKHNK